MAAAPAIVTKPIIVAEEVTKRFGTHQVLTRVTLPVMIGLDDPHTVT